MGIIELGFQSRELITHEAHVDHDCKPRSITPVVHLHSASPSSWYCISISSILPINWHAKAKVDVYLALFLVICPYQRPRNKANVNYVMFVAIIYCVTFFCNIIWHILLEEQWLATATLWQVGLISFLMTHSSSLVSFPWHSISPYPPKLACTLIYP